MVFTTETWFVFQNLNFTHWCIKDMYALGISDCWRSKLEIHQKILNRRPEHVNESHVPYSQKTPIKVYTHKAWY